MPENDLLFRGKKSLECWQSYIRKPLSDLIQNKSGTCFEARSTKYM